MKIAFVLVASLLTTAAMAADDTPKPPADAAAEKKVCRREEATGSIMGKRVCHTKSEWAAIDVANARAMEEFNNRHRSASDNR